MCRRPGLPSYGSACKQRSARDQSSEITVGQAMALSFDPAAQQRAGA
jgi:hypothetical protein